MRKMILSSLVLAAAFVPPGATFAYAGTDHVMGEVTSVDATHLELTTRDGKTVSVQLLPDTRFMKAGHEAAAADVTTGVRVIVETEAKGDALEAKQVTISSSGYGSAKKN